MKHIDELNKAISTTIPNEMQCIGDQLHHSLSNPIDLQYKESIGIKPSTLHGNGLFALSSIPKNTVITYYPPHYFQIGNKLYWYKEDDNIDVTNLIITNKLNKHYALGLPIYNNSNDERIILIGNPQKIENKLFLGHMINDASGNIYQDISLTQIQQPIEFKNAIAKYYIKGDKSINCRYVFHPDYPIAYVVTSRDINPNEELLTFYEPRYWFYVNYDSMYDTFIWDKLYHKICTKKFLTYLYNQHMKYFPEKTLQEQLCI